MDSCRDSIGIDVPESLLCRLKGAHLMQNDTLIAVDLAKAVFEVAVSHRPGRVDRGERLSRDKFLGFFVNRPKATVVMEACGSAHFWAKKIQALGHHVVLLPPHQVRPYVLRNKTDRTDTKGMLEAYRNDDIYPVPVKTVEQQTITSLHRLRAAWIEKRTATINLLRGLLREYGLIIPLGAKNAVPHAWAFIEDADSGLPDAARPLLAELCHEIRELDQRVKLAEHQLEALAEQMPIVDRLRSIPGIGLLTATALVAFICDVQRFPSGRRLASYLGLTPREHSSALKRHLGGISKRGDIYLRTLLIHGARSALRAATTMKQPDRLRAWALRLRQTRGYNKAAVALANKMARIVWAIWKRDRIFESVAA
jgi:transposase